MIIPKANRTLNEQKTTAGGSISIHIDWTINELLRIFLYIKITYTTLYRLMCFNGLLYRRITQFRNDIKITEILSTIAKVAVFLARSVDQKATTPPHASGNVRALHFRAIDCCRAAAV